VTYHARISRGVPLVVKGDVHDFLKVNVSVMGLTLKYSAASKLAPCATFGAVFPHYSILHNRCRQN
jgi:hypothetical protein